MQACRQLRRSHPQRRQAGRSAGAEPDQVRAGHQSQDRQDAWPRSAADAPRPRRRGDRMRRREFITLLSGAAALWPLAARAQQPAMPVVGFLSSGAEQAFAPNVAGFLRGLREAGYIQGQNVAIEYRWANSHYDRLSAMATELVRRRVTILVASGGTAVARAAKEATRTIPIVFS